MNESSYSSSDSKLMDEILNEILSSGIEIANEVIDFQAHGVYLFLEEQSSSTVRVWHYLQGFPTFDPEKESIPAEDLLEAYRRGFYFFGRFQNDRTAHREGDYWKVIEERPDWAKHPWRQPNMRSVLTLPLFMNNFLLGVMKLSHKDPRFC